MPYQAEVGKCHTQDMQVTPDQPDTKMAVCSGMPFEQALKYASPLVTGGTQHSCQQIVLAGEIGKCISLPGCCD